MKGVEKVINISGGKRSVRSGPCLWVSRTLHEKGPLSTRRLWMEYIRD